MAWQAVRTSACEFAEGVASASCAGTQDRPLLVAVPSVDMSSTHGAGLQGCAQEQIKRSHPFLRKSEDMMQSIARTLLREGSKSRFGAFGASSARVIATSAAVPAQAEAAPSSTGALTREFQIYRYQRIAAAQLSSCPVLVHILRPISQCSSS